MTTVDVSPKVFDPSAPAVTMTAAAQKHFAKKLSAEQGKIIRLYTETSGCTGYAYRLDFAEQAQADDLVLQPADGITLAVSQEALKLVRGTEIDMVTEGINRVVKFNNPNVVAECGCGESFSVD